jgi:hypothetical protein
LRKVAFPVFAQNDAPSWNLERDQEKWSPVFRPDRATSERIESGQGAGMASIPLKPL